MRPCAGAEPDSLDRLIARARTPSQVLARNAHMLLNKPTPASRRPASILSKQDNSRASRVDTSVEPHALNFATQEDHTLHVSPLQSSVADAAVHASPRQTPAGPAQLARGTPRPSPSEANKPETMLHTTPMQCVPASKAGQTQRATPRLSSPEAFKKLDASQVRKHAAPMHGSPCPSLGSRSSGHKATRTHSSTSPRRTPRNASKHMAMQTNSPRMSPCDPRKPSTPSSLAALVKPSKLALALPSPEPVETGRDQRSQILPAADRRSVLRPRNSIDTPRPGTKAVANGAKNKPLTLQHPQAELPSLPGSTYSETVRAHIERCRTQRAEREALSESLSHYGRAAPASFGEYTEAQPSSLSASFWSTDCMDPSLSNRRGGFGLRPSSVPGHFSSSQNVLSSSSSRPLGVMHPPCVHWLHCKTTLT